MLEVKEIKTTKVPKLGVILETKATGVKGMKIRGTIFIAKDDKGFFPREQLQHEILDSGLWGTQDRETMEELSELYEIEEGEKTGEFGEDCKYGGILSEIFDTSLAKAQKLTEEEKEALVISMEDDLLRTEMWSEGHIDESEVSVMRELIEDLKTMMVSHRHVDALTIR